MPTHTVRKLAVAFALLAACALPCRAADKLLKGDYSHNILRLESFQPVTTWEQDGVQVFVTTQGGMVRQGDMRLNAPRMVVWFQKADSEQARKAIVRVYAESSGSGHGHPAAAVDLVEDGSARKVAALLMTFTSTFSFVVDCPLTKSEKPVPSGLLSKAVPLLKGTDEQTWSEVPPAPAATPFESAAEGLKAEHVEVFWDQSTAVYIGDVHGEYGNLVVRADNAVLWYNPQFKNFEVYAEGNVRLSRRPGSKIPEYEPNEQLAVMDLVELAKADQLYVNPGRARGLATNVEVRAADPNAAADLIYVFRGKQAYLIDDSTLTVRQVSLTTCNFEVPHYQFAADRAQIVRRAPSTILNMWKPKFQVGSGATTLLSLPFIGTDLTQRAYLLENYALGTSKKYGFFVQTAWRPLDLASAPPTWVESWLVNLDYYSDRGPGIGTELAYQFGKDGLPQSKGDLTAYFVSDSASKDSTGLPVPRSDRGLVHLRHRTQFSPDWRADLEYYWISDMGFLREFFEYNFQNEKVPESYLLARYLHNSTYLALLYKQQVNDFVRQVEETPSLDLEVSGFPLGPLVYEGQVTGGIYDLEPSSLVSPTPANPPSLGRLHTEHSVALPFMLAFLRIDPSLRVLATWASEGVDAMGNFTGSPSRTGVGAGITASTTLSRVYDVTSELFDLNRLRHIIIPYVDLQTLSVSGSPSADFIQMDHIDAIDSMTQATIGLRQRLQTKRMKNGEWTPVNWLDSRLALVTQSSDSADKTLDDTYLTWDIDFLLNDHVSLHSWDNRVGGSNSPDVINAGILFDFLPTFTLGLDYDYITNVSSVVTLDLFYKLSDRYQLLLKQQSNLNSQASGSNKSLETYLVLRRLLHEWVLDIGVHYEQATNEFAVVFGFGPSGWGLYKSPRRAGRL